MTKSTKRIEIALALAFSLACGCGDAPSLTPHNGAPLSVAPPNFVELEIVETDPGLKGDTASGGSKPATLSTGAVVKVPLFLSQGEVIRIDTRTGEYQGRASKS